MQTHQVILLSALAVLLFFTMGCTENNIQSPPSTLAQTFRQLFPDENFTQFKLGADNNLCVRVDWNKFEFGNCVDFLLDANIVGAEGQIPFLNFDGNALEVDSNFDYNKVDDSLRVGGTSFFTDVNGDVWLSDGS